MVRSSLDVASWHSLPPGDSRSEPVRQHLPGLTPMPAPSRVGTDRGKECDASGGVPRVRLARRAADRAGRGPETGGRPGAGGCCGDIRERLRLAPADRQAIPQPRPGIHPTAQPCTGIGCRRTRRGRRSRGVALPARRGGLRRHVAPRVRRLRRVRGRPPARARTQAGESDRRAGGRRAAGGAGRGRSAASPSGGSHRRRGRGRGRSRSWPISGGGRRGGRGPRPGADAAERASSGYRRGPVRTMARPCPRPPIHRPPTAAPIGRRC